MKWFGNHIWDFISRFRNDVYLEDVDTGTIASGGNLGLDSNNKIVKNTVSGGGDFTLTADSGSNQSISTGNTMDIAGGNAISTVVGATDTVTINHDDTSSQESVNNSGSAVIQDITLDTYGHVTGLSSKTIGKSDVGLGNVTDISQEDLTSAILTAVAKSDVGLTSVEDKSSADIRSEIVESDIPALATSKITSGTFDDARIPNLNASKITAGTLSVSRGGTGATSAADSFNALKQSATEGATGVVELATTDEADTGTDTARAVTPAGLKSHVNARFTYQYISFTGNAQIDTNWATPGTNGPFTHNYNPDTGVNGTSVGSTTHNFARSKQNGFIVPYDNAVLVGFYGMIRNNTANNQGALGLFHSTYATFGARQNTSTFTLQAYAAADTTGGAGSSYQGQCKAIDLARSLDLTAGDIIIPAIMQASEKAYAQFTIVIKTPII